MQNKFRKFEEIVFYDLWIPDSGFRFPVPDSGFRLRIPVSGFRVLGLPIHVHLTFERHTGTEGRELYFRAVFIL